MENPIDNRLIDRFDVKCEKKRVKDDSIYGAWAK